MARMSMKRQATAELNHENWDQEEPKDNDLSTFKMASKDVLEKRVIRSGKRRFYAPSGDDARKNVFSGFQGFAKPQTNSFEFLTNLTNGTKTTSNGSLMTSTDSSFTSPSPFGIKPSTPSSSLFQIPTIPLSCDTSSKPANIFGPSIKSSVFQTPSNTTSNVGSIFSSPKDSTAQPSTFRIPSTGNATVTNNFLTPIKSDGPTFSNSTNVQNTSPIFGTTSINQSVSPTTTLSDLKTTQSNSGGSSLKKTESIVTDLTSAGTQTKDTNVVKFYSKLASLNKAVTEWVKKHVEDTPLCILTPIFRDYEKYLKELQSKYGMENIESELESELQSKSTDSETKTSNTFECSSKTSVSNLFSNHNNKNTGNDSLFNTKTDVKDSAALVGSECSEIPKTTSTNLPTFSFGTSSNTIKTTPTFSFGVNNSTVNTSTTNDTAVTFTVFSKGPSAAVSAPTTNTFSFNMNTPSTTTVNVTPSTFSFGGKPNNTDSIPSFSFGVPSSTKIDDGNRNTLFSNANKPSTTTHANVPTFSFENPTSSSTTTTTISTLAFNAKSTTSSDSPTLYTVGGTTNTTTTPVPSTFSFSPKPTGATAVSPFNINMSSSPLSSTSSSSTFSFAMKSPLQDQNTAAAAPFSFNMNTPINTVSESKPFSFGTGKPFTFNTENKMENSQQSEKEEDEEPPKIEFTPVVEENSVYDKRCKVYVKRDGSFVDKGVGTLYIKKVDDSGKHQLLVRANTNLGNILINLILSKNIPLQRLAKSDVMMGCIPTPDEKPHPIPVLIRVKTSEEADELLETLKKYS